MDTQSKRTAYDTGRVSLSDNFWSDIAVIPMTTLSVAMPIREIYWVSSYRPLLRCGSRLSRRIVTCWTVELAPAILTLRPVLRSREQVFLRSLIVFCLKTGISRARRLPYYQTVQRPPKAGRRYHGRSSWAGISFKGRPERRESHRLHDSTSEQ
jgi:hypothetical protein